MRDWGPTITRTPSSMDTLLNRYVINRYDPSICRDFGLQLNLQRQKHAAAMHMLEPPDPHDSRPEDAESTPDRPVRH